MATFAYCGSSKCNKDDWKRKHPEQKSLYNYYKTYKLIFKPNAKGADCPDCGASIYWKNKKDLRIKHD